MKMAKVLGVSHSGYYAWVDRGQSTHEKEEQELSELRSCLVSQNKLENKCTRTNFIYGIKHFISIISHFSK